MIAAVVFDLDGVIVDSEHVWAEVREQYARSSGGTYTDTATRDMMGMSAPEWSRYMADSLGVPGTPEEISAASVGTVRSASASASSSGGKCAFGTATTVMPAVCAERMPLCESSIATQPWGSTPRRRAASR